MALKRAGSANLEMWGKKVRCDGQRIGEDGRVVVCMSHSDAGWGINGTKVAEGGWNRKERLRVMGAWRR